MSKPITLEFGKYYHIFSRGIDRCTIFFEERNYVFFMKRYAFFVEPIADTYAFSLLRNHFHAMIRTRTVDDYSSYETLVLAKASWLRRHEVIDWFGDVQAFEALHDHPVMSARLVPLALEGW